MVFQLLGRLVWGTAKFGVKHVVVPIAISMAVAAILSRLTEKVEGDGMARSQMRLDADPAMAP